MDYTLSQDGDTCTVTISGPMTVLQQQSFSGLLAACTDQNAKTLRIDVGSVDMVDSTGLGLLLMLNKITTSTGGTTVLFNVGKSTARALQLARFDQVFTIE